MPAAKKGAMKAVSAKEQADLIDIIVKGKAQSIAGETVQCDKLICAATPNSLARRRRRSDRSAS